MNDRSVLLIAFHFPPIQGSSGWQRTFRFAQYLPRYGWRPIVLTVDPRAYEARQADPGGQVPPDMAVHRVFGLDTARHLSLFGRYPGWLAVPDRWATWRFAAVPSALRLIRESNVRAVWSTFPIATAHAIGRTVADRSGLPWIAEFRDPMWQGDYPPEPAMNSAWQALERDVFAAASAVVVTTPGAVRTYAERFPSFDADRIVLIENGYDEETFRRAEGARGVDGRVEARAAGRPVRLLHSGIVYRSERDPSQLFAALADLKRLGRLNGADLQIVFRACGDETGYRRDIAALGIDDIVQLEPPLGYVEALQEMLAADGLLILQAANCNAQVPAKLYEYLRAGRPILALTDPEGDTAATLARAQAGTIARLDSAAEIADVLPRFIAQLRAGNGRTSHPDIVSRYSRESQAGAFARLLDQVCGK